MQLNLRKARKLEQKLQKHVDAQQFTTNSEVRVKGTVEQALRQIDVDKKIFVQDLQQANALLELRFSLRNRIGDANSKLGLNTLMNSKELLESKLKVLTKAALNSGSQYLGGGKVSTTPDEASLDDMLKIKAGILERTTNEYNTSPTTQVSIFTEAEVEGFEQQVRDISKQQEDIEDDLSQKNIGGTVTLTADEVTLLKTVGLV